MKRILITLTLAATLFPTGCHNDQPRPREIVILPDLSASIDRRAQQQMFEGIKEVARHMHRGDSLTIIPIMGNAEADLSGQILCYEIPPAEKREAYDGDLRRIRAQVENDLSRLSAEVVAHPGTRTDILGTIRVANGAFSNEPTDKRLIILSDFIQDGEQFNFAVDRRLDSVVLATALARRLVKDITIQTPIKLTMGRLRSAEFGRLSARRRLAIDAFWEQLFRLTPVHDDGILTLQNALAY